MTRKNHMGSFILRGGTVLDGSGSDARRADVAVADGLITDVSERIEADGARHIDAADLVIAPGFIDLHTHCDFTLPHYPRADAMVRQGVTTVVTGNCGHSAFPVGEGQHREEIRSYSAFLADDLDWSWSNAPEYAQILSGLPLALNVALLAGHGTIRVAVMGFDARPPTGAEQAKMHSMAADAMDAGVFGISSGLIYPPGSYAATDELVAIAEVAGQHGGFYATHMRNEGPGLLAAVGEALHVAERAGLPLQISHHKVLGRKNWGLTQDSLQLISEARQRGLDVTLDQYPYPASSTTLTALLPAWAIEGGVEQMRARLRHPSQRAQIRAEVIEGPGGGRPKRDFEPDTVMIASVPGDNADLAGHSLEQIAARRASDPVDLMLDLLAEHGASVQVVIFAIGENDIRRVLSDPHVAVASDGWTLHPDAGGCPHPRSYGTFVRVLGHYVREEGLLRLPEAVRKMTSLPAQRLGLTDRGTIQPGAIADLVVFDPSAIAEKATFTAPHQFCEGVAHVFVNGVHVIDNATDTGLPAGTVLRKPGAPPGGIASTAQQGH